MQLSGKNGSSGGTATVRVKAGRVKAGRDQNGGAHTARLADLRPGEAAILDAIDLPSDDARRLMELGFLPGSLVTVARRSPFGDPHVFRVDGSEIAIRRETARHLILRPRANGA